MKSLSIILLILCWVLPSSAQRPKESQLKDLSFEALIDVFDQYSRDSLYAKQVARVYIAKATRKEDSTRIARGYQRIAFVSPLEEAVRYLDTTISFSVGSKHPNFPASGYLFKSLYLYELEQYEESLQNALKGYRYSKEKQNISQQISALQLIMGVNELWGDYRTALDAGFVTQELLFENSEIPEFMRHYLSSLETIGKCYVRLNKPDSALVYFRKGISATLKARDSVSYYAFVSQSGTAYYARGEFRRALDSLFKADAIRELYNNSYLPAFYYYVGSSYYQMGKEETGMDYFYRIDSLYTARNILTPELPSVYENMVEYYAKLGSREKQLEYLRKQVHTLRLIDEKRLLVKNKTNQDYVIPAVLAKKEEEIAQLESRNRRFGMMFWASVFLLLLASGFFVYYFRRQRRFQKRFEELIRLNNQGDELDTKVPDLVEIGISEEIIRDVLYKIDKFETEGGFRDRLLTLNKLAREFDTNSTYLSRIVNVKKAKNFSRYLNDLRVDYAARELKQRSTFRKYTIKAIAYECGFKSAESFSRSFYRKYGIYPSYYIKQLEGS